MNDGRFPALRYACFGALCGLLLGACTPPAYSPNTYSSNAVQLANKVDSGLVVGYREVKISSDGTIGTVAGGAAGGLLGGEYANSALAAIGGTAVGAIVGSKLDHAVTDTTGWEYIIRKANGDMLSVTQREPKPIAIGQRVLVINGPQARVIPDYSVASEQPPPKEKTESKPETPVKVEVVLSLPPGVSAQTLSNQGGGSSVEGHSPANPQPGQGGTANQTPPSGTVVTAPNPAPPASPTEAPGL